ncbi:MAG TPA: lysylphosphatidylglycerol synthase transmembrane domain-containing protein [Bacteroidia bacterium]|nr:lysylphosphatidylglycerol synthase transmembrane domain-containing protein [Bacteroidia bacterium]
MTGKNKKSLIQFVVLLSIGILLVWLSLRQVAPQKDNIINAFKNANYFWVAVSMLISVLSHFLRAYRWNYLLKPVGQKTNLLNATCEVLVGYLANYGIPRMGEVTRCTLASKYDNVPFEVGFGTVITERIIDFLLFLIIFALTLLVQFNELIGLANEYVFDNARAKFAGMAGDPFKLFLFIAIIVVLIAAFLFLRKRFSSLLKGKFGSILKGMGEGIGSVRKMESPVRFVVLSLSIWVCYFYALYVGFFAIEGTSHLGMKECLTLLLLGTFGVIFSPGGLGAYPLILYGILVNTYHVDEVSAFALPWLGWTSQFLLIVVLGILSLIILPLYNRKKNVVS